MKLPDISVLVGVSIVQFAKRSRFFFSIL